MSVISITLAKPIDRHENEHEEDSMMQDDELDDILETKKRQVLGLENNTIVTPGELITEDATWMRGHGTYYLDEHTYTSTAGVVSKVNKLLSVIPFNGRYRPETGDHVVGRILVSVIRGGKSS